VEGIHASIPPRHQSRPCWALTGLGNPGVRRASCPTRSLVTPSSSATSRASTSCRPVAPS